MTTRKYSSRSQQTTLTGALTSSGTSATVVSGSALLGGVTISAGETFTVVIDPDTALEEIVDVTAVSTNTLTIVRGIDGSTGQTHSAGAVVRHMAIGRDYREANTHIENTTTAHGLTLADVTLSTGTGNVSTTMLASNAVTTAKITDANVTTAKIADSAITSAKIADLTIATGDIADSAITSGKIATGAVGTAKIDDLSVTEGKLAPTAVTAAKIATDAVTTAKIQDSAVTSAKIANDTIVNADINSAAAIDATKISGTAVTQADTGTVTSTMIANGTIVNADINTSAAIAKTKLDLGGTITSADLVDGTIVATDIADGTITAAKMVSDPYARANHTGTQAASTISDFDTQVRTSRLDQMAAPTGSVNANSQKITSLGTPTSNADAATKLYVDTKVADLVNSAPSTLDTLGEIATAIQAGGTVYDSFVLKAGSTMTGALTLSGAPTVDLHAATKAYVDTVAGSATAAAASAAAAATTYDNFDDRYLGSKSSAPSVDNDGNALLTGALYWNSVSNTMFAWNGSAWGSISSTADIYRYRYTASGGETSESGPDDNGLTLSYIVGKEQVYLNGVLLVRSTDYVATNGTSITSLAALTAGDILEVITFTAFDLANVISPTVIDAKGDLIAGTSADTIGKLTVGSNGQVLKANSATATGLEWGTIDLSTKQDVVSGVSDTEIGYLDGVTSAIQTQINGKVPATIVDAKGDIIAATAADTVARLAVGSNDQVLTADSSTATGLKWATPAAGGMTLLSTTTLSGATTTISGISGSYKSLVAYIYGVTNATAVGTFRCAPNNNPSFTNSTIYKSLTLVAFSNNYLFLSSNATSTGQPDNADADNAWTLTIDNYASAATAKNFQVYGGFANGYGQYGFTATGRIISTAAITSLVFSNSGGNLSTGTVLLYGVN